MSERGSGRAGGGSPSGRSASAHLSPTAGAASPPWQPHARLVAAIFLLVIGLGLLLRLGRLLIPVILGFVLAYLLDPLVTNLSRVARIPRWTSVVLVYLVLVLVVSALIGGTGLVITQQLIGIVNDLGTLSAQLPEFLQRLTETTLVIGPWRVDLSQVNLDPMLGSLGSAIQPLLTQTGAILGSVAGATASVIGLILVVMLFGYYLLLDFGALDDYLLHFVPRAYQADFTRLLRSTQLVWRAFLRGQLILGAVIGALVGLAFSAIGVRFALVLGLIAGILELVPTFGPLVAGTLAVLVALFQGPNALGLTPGSFALVVIGVSFLIQQAENNLLVPRIIGGSLNLHPMVVLLGAILGGSMAGILGVLLAAPVIATSRLWLGYFYRKVVGLETWPEDSTPHLPPRRSFTDRLRGLWNRLSRRA